MAGIALGILALLGVRPVLLCAVALVVLGAALIFASASESRFALLSTARYGFSDITRRVIDESVGLSVGGESFVAVGAIVLGVLALLGIRPMTLVLWASWSSEQDGCSAGRPWERERSAGDASRYELTLESADGISAGQPQVVSPTRGRPHRWRVACDSP